MRKLFILLLCFSFASMQEQDTVLTSYDLALESLETASTVMSDDSVKAREELDRALNSPLRVLSAYTSSEPMIAALENTFERAKVATQNKSQTDLAVQIAVLKGGFWRLVYESSLPGFDSAEGFATAKLRISRIAADMGLSNETLEALEASQQPLQLLASFEKGIAEQVDSRLALADSEAAIDQGASYRHLASAYGTFLPVQDSPRVGAEASGGFSTAFAAVVAGDTEALSSQIASLQEQMLSFQNEADTLLVEQNEVASQAAQAPAETAPVVEEVTEEVAQVATEAVTIPADSSDPVAVVSPAVDTVATEAPSEPIATEAAAPMMGTPIDVNALSQALGRYNLSDTQQARLVEGYIEEGYAGTQDVLDELFADSARAVVAVEIGDQAGARSLIGNVKETYQSYLEPLVNSQDEGFNSSTLRLMNTLGGSPSLRLQDAVVLTGHVDAISSLLANNPPSGLHQAIVGTTNVWAGWLRMVLITLLGICAFVPLYLLYLAFGGGNRNWQLVGWALFLLLLPLIYEGFSFLASLLANLFGITWLNAPASFSIFQNTISQLIWVIVTGVAIGLAIAGLYGICVQFGLLGKRQSADGKDTVLDTAAASTMVNSSFDWDEEF